MSNLRIVDDEDAYYARVREESSRDKSRNLDRRKMADWKPSPIVDEWPCRNRSCRQNTPVTRECEDVFEQMNLMLAAKGEQQLRTDEVVVCDACRKRLRELAQGAADRQVSRAKQLVVEYKSDPEPGAERKAEIERELERIGHPDVRGLVEAVKRRREGKAAQRPERRGV